MQFETEVVIHDAFGGFSLTDEIVERLKERKCAWADKLQRASHGEWYLFEDDEFRRDPDLVAVVKEIREELDRRVEDLHSWRDRAALEQEMLHGLKVVRVAITLEIEDYDGKETVRVRGGVA